MSGFRPPFFERSRAGSNMKSSWPRRMRLPLLVATLSIFGLMLSGCAGPTRIACDEPKTLPEELAAPLLPDARSYSSDVRTFLREVEAWLKTTQQSTTQP